MSPLQIQVRLRRQMVDLVVGVLVEICEVTEQEVVLAVIQTKELLFPSTYGELNTI